MLRDDERGGGRGTWIRSSMMSTWRPAGSPSEMTTSRLLPAVRTLLHVTISTPGRCFCKRDAWVGGVGVVGEGSVEECGGGIHHCEVSRTGYHPTGPRDAKGGGGASSPGRTWRSACTRRRRGMRRSRCARLAPFRRSCGRPAGRPCAAWRRTSRRRSTASTQRRRGGHKHPEGGGWGVHHREGSG